MPKVNSSALQVDMKVESDVRNADGMLLIPAGCCLTERHLTILESWGVTEIEVAVPEGMDVVADPLAKLAPETLERLRAEASSRFVEVDEGNPAAVEVVQIVLRRLARKLASSQPA